jgi:hypothetical protein
MCGVGFQRRDTLLKHMTKSHSSESSDVKKESLMIQEFKEESTGDQNGTNYVVLASTPEIYTIQNPDGSYTQVQTLQVVEEN